MTTPTYDPKGPRWSVPVPHDLYVVILRAGASQLIVGERLIEREFFGINVDDALAQYEQALGRGVKVMSIDSSPSADFALGAPRPTKEGSA